MILLDTWHWLTDPASWAGGQGIGRRTVEHLWYSLLTVLPAAAIALPLGAWIGHTGRARWLITVANSLRAIPSLGLLLIASLLLAPRFQGASDLAYVLPSVLVLVVLAVPPILAATTEGVAGVDPAARDAARGMGMTEAQVLRRVELPCALPLMLSGLRGATLQVVATATIAAATGLGGLGRFVIDGIALADYPQMLGGSVVVALLALLVDGLWALVQRLVVSPGLTGRAVRARHGGPTGDTDPDSPDGTLAAGTTGTTDDLDRREQAPA